MYILICTSLHVCRSSIHVYNPPIYIIKPSKYLRIQLFIYMYIYNSLICVYNSSCCLSLSLSCLSFPVFVLFFIFYLFSLQGKINQQKCSTCSRQGKMFWARITVKEQYAKVFCHYGHITVTALITSSLWFLRLKIFSAATVNANRKKITDF
jgi:hypothetical protein